MPPILLLMILPVMGGLFIGYLGLRLVRAFEQKSGGTREIAALAARVEQLENSLEQQSTELRRLSDGQSFAEQLLAGRTQDPKSTVL
jgi:hypothetical protein